MTGLLVFTCLFVPLTTLSFLSAGRDLLLFQRRERVPRWVTLAWMVAGLVVLHAIGMPTSWAVALVVVGPAASVTGQWMGSGDWRVLDHRLRHLGR